MNITKKFWKGREMGQVGEGHVYRSHTEVGQKIGLENIKTKIYQTIQGLIILFIKF